MAASPIQSPRLQPVACATKRSGDEPAGDDADRRQCRGAVLKLGQPWGGVDPKTGRISDPRHPDYDKEIAGLSGPRG